MVCAILITEDADCEVLHVGPGDLHHDLQEPVHQVCLSKTTQLLWSSRYSSSKVNDYASRLVGQTVVGDAFLLSSLNNTQDVDHMINMSRHLAPLKAALKRGPSWPLQPWANRHTHHRQPGQLCPSAAAIGHQHPPAPAGKAAATARQTAATFTAAQLLARASGRLHTPAPIQQSEQTESQTASAPAATSVASAFQTDPGGGPVTTVHPAGTEGALLVSRTLLPPAAPLGIVTADKCNGPESQQHDEGLQTSKAAQPEQQATSHATTLTLSPQQTVEEQATPTEPEQAASPQLPPWEDLDGALLMQVFLMLPHQASGLLPVLHVCQSWRQTLLSHDLTLRHIWFCLDPFHPLKASSSSTSSGTAVTSSSNTSTCTAAASSSSAALTPRPPFTRHWLPPRNRTSLGSDDSHPAVHLHSSHLQQAASQVLQGALPTGTQAAASTRTQHQQSVARVLEEAVSSQTAAQARALLRRPPRVLQVAARHGNVSAMGCLAQLHEVAGNEEDAVRLWKKCAKSGDTEACLRLGMAYYVGAPGCPMDSESAHQWLSKGLKQVLGVTQLSDLTVNLTNATLTLTLPPGTALAGLPAGQLGLSGTGAGVLLEAQRVSMTLRQLWTLRGRMTTCGNATRAGDILAADCAQRPAGAAATSNGAGGYCLRQQVIPAIDFKDPQLQSMVASAAVIAGYIVHDGEGGEGTRLDRSQAVTLFKLAVLAESREAARILAWVFSTGQF